MPPTASDAATLGTLAAPFSLPNTNQKVGKPIVSRSDYQDADALLVAFICNHCPYVIHIREGLVKFARQYSHKNLATVAICSNDAVGYPADSAENMAADAEKYDYPFAYLHDETQQVAQNYQAVCTPDFFLYDKAHKLYYRGRFDASTPGNQQPVTGSDLAQAADCLLAGQPWQREQMPSMGCSIKWR